MRFQKIFMQNIATQGNINNNLVMFSRRSQVEIKPMIKQANKWKVKITK